MSIESTQTVGELAAALPGATREFEKLGIDYCCGGSRSLEQACAQANISIDEALARLQQGLAAGSTQEQRNWQNEPLTGLIAHISGTHHVFVRAEYRGLVYNSPTYDLAGLDGVDRTTHRAEPSVGFGYRW